MRRIRLIAGPCSAETSEQVKKTAEGLALLRPSLDALGFDLCGFRAGVWKPRTRPGGFEGVGEDALSWLAGVQDQYGVPAAVEVAGPAHVEAALKAGVKMLWIGARTATNPFDTQAIADALKGVPVPVLVKNPMNPDVDLWVGAVERIALATGYEVGAVLRGFSFYERSRYRNFPKWQVAVDFRRRMPQTSLFCDASHIAGQRCYLREISQKALDLGFDGLFLECHCNPDFALSDSQQQLPPAALLELLSSLVVRDTASDSAGVEELARLREQIDLLDDGILDLLSQRMALVDELGSVKKAHNLTALQQSRWEEVLRRAVAGAADRGLDPSFVEELFNVIHHASIDRQS